MDREERKEGGGGSERGREERKQAEHNIKRGEMRRRREKEEGKQGGRERRVERRKGRREEGREDWRGEKEEGGNEGRKEGMKGGRDDDWVHLLAIVLPGFPYSPLCVYSSTCCRCCCCCLRWRRDRTGMVVMTKLIRVTLIFFFLHLSSAYCSYLKYLFPSIAICL